MATFLRLLGFSTDDGKVDPATGLTDRQKKLVQNTWAVVKKDQVASGVALMLAFFEKYPAYKGEFSAFRDVPNDELASSKRFQAHCASIMSAFTNAVDSLHDPGLMEAGLVVLAERHKKRGQTGRQFQDLKGVVLEVLRQSLGKQYTPEVAEAWGKTADAMFSRMCAILDS